MQRNRIPEPVEHDEIEDRVELAGMDVEFYTDPAKTYRAPWEMTLQEIARIEGVTTERIRQIEAKALRKLRDPQRTKHLRIFTVSGKKPTFGF